MDTWFRGFPNDLASVPLMKPQRIERCCADEQRLRTSRRPVIAAEAVRASFEGQ
jgi:hypothetical protein